MKVAESAARPRASFALRQGVPGAEHPRGLSQLLRGRVGAQSAGWRDPTSPRCPSGGPAKPRRTLGTEPAIHIISALQPSNVASRDPPSRRQLDGELPPGGLYASLGVDSGWPGH